MKNLFFCLLAFFIGECENKSSNLQKLEAVVELRYTEDKTKLNNYWLTSTRVRVQEKKYFLIKDISDIAGLLSLECDLEEEFAYFSKSRNSIYSLKEYRSQQNLEEDEFGIHNGGNVYLNKNNKAELIISFNVKAEGFILDKSPCENFNFQSTYSCPIERETEFYPLIILANIISSSNLSDSQMLESGLIEKEEKKFYVNYCD